MFQSFESTRRNQAHQLARWVAISMACLAWALPFQAAAQEIAEDQAAAESPASKSALPSEVSEALNPVIERMRLLVTNIKHLDSLCHNVEHGITGIKIIS